MKTHKIAAMLFCFVFLSLLFSVSTFERVRPYFENIAKVNTENEAKQHGSNFMSFYFIVIS